MNALLVVGGVDNWMHEVPKMPKQIGGQVRQNHSGSQRYVSAIRARLATYISPLTPT